MNELYQRTQSLIGIEAIEKLKKSHVAVFGLGGVGGYTVEALARAGVGKFDLIDNDTVSEYDRLMRINPNVVRFLITRDEAPVQEAKK